MSADRSAGNQSGADGEVSRRFRIGLLVAGLLLFSLFVWATLSGGTTPL